MEKRIKVRSFPASYGESFLLSFEGENNTFNILIDTGFVSTAEIISEELKKMKYSNQKLDLIIFTHIDNDHINGARELLRQIFEEKIVDIGEIWYNDYFKIFETIFNSNDTNKMTENDEGIVKEILNISYSEEKGIFKTNDVGYKNAQYIEQYLCDKGRNIEWNKMFDEKCIMIEDDVIRKKISDELSIVVINPCFDILQKEFYEWKEYLIEKGFQSSLYKNMELAHAFEITLLEHEKRTIEYKEKECGANDDNEIFKRCIEYNQKDEGIINRTSISIVIEFHGKKLFFLGDGSPIELEKAIKKYMGNITECNVDLIKVPHHGSKYNWSNVINTLVKSSKYLIATNGKIFNHPDIETVVKIISSSTDNKKIFFNYKPDKIIREISKMKEIEKYPYEFVCENDKKTGKGIQEIIL